MLFSTTVYADTTIEFSVTESGSTQTGSQIAYVKDGTIFVKGAGGDPQIDLLFNREHSSITIINHGDRTYVSFDEEQISELSDRAQGMMSMVQKQLAENLANLPPEQAARMKEMMGNIGMPAGNEPPPPKQKLIKRGIMTINKMKCRQIDVMSNDKKVAQLCVAEPSALNLPGDDYETIKAIQSFGERLSQKASKISGQFGGSVPEFGGMQIDGVPVQMRNLSGPAPSVMTVTRLAAGVGKVSMAIPDGYKPRQLPSLPQM
jgi:hypothetical protein